MPAWYLPLVCCFFVREETNPTLLPLVYKVLAKYRDNERDRMQCRKDNGNNLSSTSLIGKLGKKKGETNVYGHRFWSIQPDRYAYPSCTKEPHPIVTQGDYEYAEYIDNEEICESFPLIPVTFTWVCGIPSMAKSDARI